uniref:Uncharacterized protein n=1 Tax=Poecilia reticulata TaxID=8081 RepID=A0A3P9PC05_POERE
MFLQVVAVNSSMEDLLNVASSILGTTASSVYIGNSGLYGLIALIR